MSKRPTSLAISLRSDNSKAILLIKAIVNHNLESVIKIIDSVVTHREKKEIINSIKVQASKDHDAEYDSGALLKLVAQIPDSDDSRNKKTGVSDNAKIKLLVEGFVSTTVYSKVIELDLACDLEKTEVDKKNSCSLDHEINILLGGLAFIDSAGLAGSDYMVP